MPMYIDVTEVEIRGAVGESRTDDPRIRSQLERDAASHSGVLLSAGRESKALVGIEAWEALLRIRAYLDGFATEVVDLMAPWEWLWCLRRLCGQFDINATSSTGPYCQVLAESLTANSRLRSAAAPLGVQSELAVSVTSDRVIALQRLRHLTILIYEIHSLLRWAGKNSPITFTSSKLPDAEPSSDLAASVRLYDDRGTKGDASMLAGAGLAVAARGHGPTPSTILVVHQLTQEVIVPLPPGFGGRITDVAARFSLTPLDLAGVGILNDLGLPGDLRWADCLPELSALLLTSFSPPFLETGIVTTLMRGYRVLRPRYLEEELEFALDWMRKGRLGELIPQSRIPTSPSSVLERLSPLNGATWPPQAGPPVRLAGNRALVDLFAASDLLSNLLRRPDISGAHVNMWARHFEHQTQGIIDRSDYAPSPTLRTLVGRKLTLRGEVVTDLDSVAEVGGRLLLVSCKAWPFSREYNRGEFAAIRNTTERVIQAVDEWESKTRLLRENRVGDNYDFTRYADIDGVVVMPFRPFVRIGPCTVEVLPGLRAAVGIGEFERWLFEGGP